MCPRRAGNTENPVIPQAWRDGEIAVVGIGTTGVAVATTLAAAGVAVYASDVADTPAVRRAAAALEASGLSVQIGGHDLARIARARAVVVSPGVPPKAPPLRAALEADRDVWSEIDLASLSLQGRKVIGVTGTNGKTTTTALIDHVLRSSGVSSIAAGNIGIPFITAVQNSAIDWFVVELSSFQLHNSKRLAPKSGVLTNLAPDHMDWYQSAEAYYADKKRMFLHADGDSHWVVNADQQLVTDLVDGIAGCIERFSIMVEADAHYDRQHHALMCAGERVIARDAFALLGDHNVANALAGVLVAKHVGLTVAEIREGLRTMQALPHRLEPVRIHQRVTWVNDSKATNVASAQAALDAVTGPVVLILGGRGKGEDFGRLSDSVRSKARAVMAYGEAAAVIERDLSGIDVRRVETLDQAVRAAHQAAKPGDTVLLSPACASFDQYENYMHRGDTFRVLAHQL